MRRAGSCTLVIVSVLHLGSFRTAAAVDFQREIRPILSQNCFFCHGPDEKERKAGLRFDIRENALKPAKSGKIAIVPGKPAESELVARLSHADDDERMPPEKSGKR